MCPLVQRTIAQDSDSGANIIENEKQQSIHTCWAGHILMQVGLLKHMQKICAVVIGET
jgi:hypothetical protein